MIKNISAQELTEILKKNPESVQLIDVREEDEYNEAHIKNAKLIPMNSIMGRTEEIDFSKQVVFYCHSGARSMYVANIMGAEKDVWNLEGGVIGFSKIGSDFWVS